MPSPRLVAVLVVLAAAALALPGGASASIKIAGDARKPALRVNANGVATVVWRTSSGRFRTAIVGRKGRVTWGKVAPGRDVSRPTTEVRIPMKVVLRKTPDGRYWALQNWRRLKTGPWELRLSRWRGAPTKLEFWTYCCKWRSEIVRGRATYHGRPIVGYNSTPQGVPLDGLGRNVYIDSMRGGTWMRLMGILTRKPEGRFGLWIRKGWRGSSYRGRIAGPNWGRMLGPDAQGWARSSL